MTNDFFANGWIDHGLVAQFATEGTDAHRVFTSRNAWVERLGADCLISYKDSADLAGLQENLHGWAAHCALPAPRVFGPLSRAPKQ